MNDELDPRIVSSFLKKISDPDSKQNWYNVDISLSRKGLLCHVPEVAKTLQAQGLLKIVTEQSDGKRIEYYRITELGLKKLAPSSNENL